jgi:hypothetical protein
MTLQVPVYGTCSYIIITYYYLLYRVIHKPLRDFRPLRYSSRDGHAKGEHVNRGRDIPSFCPTLQVLNMLLSAVSVLVVMQPSLKVTEELTNYPVYKFLSFYGTQSFFYRTQKRPPPDPYPEPDQSSPCSHIPLPKDSS